MSYEKEKRDRDIFLERSLKSLDALQQTLIDAKDSFSKEPRMRGIHYSRIGWGESYIKSLTQDYKSLVKVVRFLSGYDK